MLKRLFDITFSFLGLLFTSPILFLTALLIKLDSAGPVFYRGTRVGKDGRLFRIYKFRSMVTNADKIGGPSTADDDPRLTRMGKIIRKYKLDELSQLINVLKGDMSFVGPRPEVPSEVETYTEEEKIVLTVRPGITDFASIKFHNEGEILKGSADPHQTYLEKIRPEKIRLQLEYVKSHSLGLDVKLIFQTVFTLLRTRA